MTRLLVFRFQVDQEEKFVRGKREGFEAGGEKCYMHSYLQCGACKRALSTILGSLTEPHLCRSQAGRNLLDAFENWYMIIVKARLELLLVLDDGMEK
jgi:hypothetical protein